MAAPHQVLARRLARSIFAAGDEPNRDLTCGRIQFMLGRFPDEQRGGGLCEHALVVHLANDLRPTEPQINPKATPLQTRVLGFIIGFRAEHHGNSPHIRDIRDALGHRSTFAVQTAITQLCRLRLLRKVGKQRFLVPRE